MAVNVWEEDKVSCHALLRGPKFASASNVEFVFKDDAGTELGRAAATLAPEGDATEAKAQWPSTKTKDGELSYHAKQTLVVDGAPADDRWTDVYVWAKSVTITAKSEDGSAAVEGAVCRLEQSRMPEDWAGRGSDTPLTDVERRTDAQGKIAFDLPYPGELTCTWKRPYILADGKWTKEKGVAREAKLKLAFRAKLVFPKPPDDDKTKALRQYVNLPRADDHPERGSLLRIRVTAKVPDEAQAGDKVYLVAKLAAENSARTASTGGHAKGTTHKAEGVLDGDKKCSFDLELGQAGGDKVTIGVGGTEACSDDQVVVETWRKLQYEVMAPKTMESKLESRTLASGATGLDLPAAMRDWWKERLAKGFVEYECWKSYAFEEADAPAGTFYDAAFIGASGGRVWVIGGGLAKTDPKSFSTAEPYTIHMRLCDKAVSPEAPATFTIDVTSATKEIPVPGYLYKISIDDGTDSISEATWEAVVDATATPTHPGVDAGAPRKGALPRSAFVHVTHKKLKIVLEGDSAGLVGAASATKCPIRVTFKWATAGGINGNAGDGRQLMVATRPPKACASTICHELGHSMGLTVKETGSFAKQVPHGLAYPPEVPDGDTYDGKGHTGTHCAFGVANKDAATYKSEQGTCIMFGQGGDEAEPKRSTYCATCLLYLKARNLTDVRSRFKGRDPGEC